jgi:hypothetical protein
MMSERMAPPHMAGELREEVGPRLERLCKRETEQDETARLVCDVFAHFASEVAPPESEYIRVQEIQ